VGGMSLHACRFFPQREKEKERARERGGGKRKRRHVATLSGWNVFDAPNSLSFSAFNAAVKPVSVFRRKLKFLLTR